MALGTVAIFIYDGNKNTHAFAKIAPRDAQCVPAARMAALGAPTRRGRSCRGGGTSGRDAVSRRGEANALEARQHGRAARVVACETNPARKTTFHCEVTSVKLSFLVDHFTQVATERV